MTRITTPRTSSRPRLLVGLASLVLPASLLAGCDGGAVEPAGFDISMRPGAPPPGAPECVTLAPTNDAMISNPPKANNYGNHPLLRVGGKDESLLAFDLSSIPAGSAIDTAVLKLYLNGGAGNNPVNIHAATAAWSEATVTYQSFNQQFDGAVAGVIQPQSPTALKSADITGLVTSWFLGAQPNLGVLLETTGNQKNIFVSSEGAAGYGPSLEVCYTVPVVDECAAEPCENGGTCENGDDGYTCSCLPGYEGTNCETNTDECAGNPCVNGECSDGVAGYTCDCDAGWEGTNCETNTDDCAGDPCQNGGICTDGIDAYSCQCDAGYSGTNCEVNIDDCAGAPCQHGGTCTDGVNSYTCACPAGYSGASCELDIDDCVGNACENESTCVDGLNAYSCSCLPGFTGTLCAENIDDCAGDPCLNGGTCDDGILGYSCDCAPGWSGANCEIDINECASSPCVNGECIDLVNDYECACTPGWTFPECDVEIDECQSSPCVNGECIDLVNDYECECTPGWTFPECDVEIDECSSSPCVNGECIDLVNDYECACLPGWTGNDCETPVEAASCPCSDMPFWAAALVEREPLFCIDDGFYVFSNFSYPAGPYSEAGIYTGGGVCGWEIYPHVGEGAMAISAEESAACADEIAAWAASSGNPCIAY